MTTTDKTRHDYDDVASLIRSKDNFVIIHATDLQPDSRKALEHSAALADRMRAALVSLHASTQKVAETGKTSAALLKGWPENKRGFSHHVVVHQEEKNPRNIVLKSMEEFGADLLVVGTRQLQDPNSGFRSSTSEVAALDGNVSTLVVHLGEPGFIDSEGNVRLRRVLLPVGDGEEARDAIRGLTAFLDRLNIEDIDIFLFRVGDDEILEYLKTPDRKGWRWHRELRHNVTIADGVSRACKEKEIDLVVMATRGQDGVIDVLNGTHTQNVIRRTPTPILVVPVDRSGD